MASLLCVQRPGGKMLIHDSEAVSHLIDPASSPFPTSAGTTSSRSKSTSLAPASSPDRKTETASSFGGRAGTIKDWLNAKSVKELQDRADKETRSTRKLLTTLFDGEKTIVKDTDDYLDEKQVLSLRKKELLHKKWSDNVYEPLREKIHKEMDGSNWPEVDRRKREMHKQYLEFSNKKGHVFLDIIDPAEYYPLAMHAHRPAPLKVATQRLRDPLLSQGSQRNEEARTVLRCVTGNHYTDRDVSQIQMPLLPLVPLGRHGTQFSTWLAMPLHNIESTDRLASRRRMRGENRHQMDFGTWAKAPFDPSVIDEEMKVQRRRTFDRVESSTNHLTHLSNPVLVDATTNTSQEVDH